MRKNNYQNDKNCSYCSCYLRVNDRYVRRVIMHNPAFISTEFGAKGHLLKQTALRIIDDCWGVVIPNDAGKGYHFQKLNITGILVPTSLPGHTGTASDQVILMVLGSGLFDGRITISTTKTTKQK
jgi:hypothetical protein